MIPLLISTAAAGPWSPPAPYILPLLNLNVVSVDGDTFAQGSGGLSVGALVQYRESPHWLSHTRGQAVGIVGIPSGSLGADVRGGSFFGPDMRFLRYQLGPDVWFNGYGSQGSLDYHLPYSPGVDLSNVVTFKVIPQLEIIGEATPGWAFVRSRQLGGVGPFHELTLTAQAVVRTPILNLNVGYTRRYQTFGIYEGLIFNIGL